MAVWLPTADLANRIYSKADGLSSIGYALANWIEGEPTRSASTLAKAGAWAALYLTAVVRQIAGLGQLARNSPIADSYIKYAAN